MLTTFRDERGWLIGAMETDIVNGEGQLDPHGAYAWVEQLELSPGVSLQAFLRQAIPQITMLVPSLKWAYWVRGDRNDIRHYRSIPSLLRYAHKRALEEVS